MPPQPGSHWGAGFYRLDDDAGTATAWHWVPVDATFHQFQRFGIVRFAE